MNRQGKSLPWSGTRDAALSKTAIWAGEGPGAVMALAEPERRDRSRSSVPGDCRLRIGIAESMTVPCQLGGCRALLQTYLSKQARECDPLRGSGSIWRFCKGPSFIAIVEPQEKSWPSHAKKSQLATRSGAPCTNRL